MEQVEGGVEELVASAHAEENRTGGVVDTHDGVAGHVDELVARLSLQQGAALFFC
jgi:hypothetical protein